MKPAFLRARRRKTLDLDRIFNDLRASRWLSRVGCAISPPMDEEGAIAARIRGQSIEKIAKTRRVSVAEVHQAFDRFCDRTLAALLWGKGYRRQPMFVFARPDGEPHDPMGLTYRLRLLMRRAKVTGHSPTHAWRHTCGTHLAKAVDTKTIQARLGHASPTTTLTFYVHPTKERDQAAGEHLAKLVKRPNGGA
jgi:integrase